MPEEFSAMRLWVSIIMLALPTAAAIVSVNRSVQAEGRPRRLWNYVTILCALWMVIASATLFAPATLSDGLGLSSGFVFGVLACLGLATSAALALAVTGERSDKDNGRK